MKPKVHIRVDGGQEFGLGHLVRCIALAQMLKKAYDISFFSKEIPMKIAREIFENGFASEKISSESEFFDVLEGNEIVVLDHYDLGTDHQRKIKEKGCRLVCIDDLHDKEFHADLIINHSPGITPQDYSAQPYTQFALGPKYALLRSNFIQAAGRERKIKSYDSVLICFGGSDPTNLTKKVLEYLGRSSLFLKITVVLGPSYAHKESLVAFANKDHVTIMEALDEGAMLQAMLSTSIAVVPASGIVMEAIAAGTVPLIGYAAPNQKNIFRFFQESGDFGCFNGLDFLCSELVEAVNKTLYQTGSLNLDTYRKQIRDSELNHLQNFKNFNHGES
jgi:UDP-2,4-diacetamido-2,4,6-trideoxy-beta-L-altropyranose hydrolase